MGRLELERYLHSLIPLSQAMQVVVLEVADSHVTLGAPLAPNVNHRGTVFGGSAATLATLAAWSLLHCRLQSCQPPASVVLQSSSMHYLRPMTGAFSARAELPSDAPWPLFRRTLERRGRARITVTAGVYEGLELAGQFSGEFVALAEAAIQAEAQALPVA